MTNTMIDLGFGVEISPEMLAKLKTGLAVHNATVGQFRKDMFALGMPQLKSVARGTGRSTRGLTVKAHFVDVLTAWHRDECLRLAGYKQNSSPNAMQRRMAASIKAQNSEQ